MPPINASRSGNRGGLAAYPHQWFDISSTYMPASVKELFKWCLYLYRTHSEIAPIINKKCAYVITGLNYDTTQDKPKELWREVLEKILKIRETELKLLLDYSIFGNGFASMVFPFERYFTCRACKHEHIAKRDKWQYIDFTFVVKCPKCDVVGVMSAKDVPVRNRARLKILRWNPQNISIDHSPVSDCHSYKYTPPKWMRERLSNKKVNKGLVEGTPLEYLKAIKERMNIEIDSDNIYHFKNASASSDDEGFGMPPMLPIFKDAWLFQTYKRAQEAIALEHILPLTLLVPQGTTGNGVSPHMSTDMGEWSRKMMEIVGRWRRDQNSIYTVPFQVGVENIRGDAKALNVFDEMNMIRQQIAGGLDVPQEFIYGGLNWSGSSISLRVLENLFLNMIEQLNSFLGDFVVPKVQRFLSLPAIKITHKDFKMADDVQQKQIVLSLRASNTVSDRTTLEELGLDPTKEAARKREESKERDAAVVQQMSVQAEAQGRATELQATYQAKAQIAMQKAQAELGLPVGKDPFQKTGAAEEPKEKPLYTAGLIDARVDQYIKGAGSPDTKRLELMSLQKTEPEIAQAIKERLRLIKRQGNAPEFKPLPEQKPPRRKNSPV